MFSSAGGFRFLGSNSLRSGIYVMQNVNEVMQTIQTDGTNIFLTGAPGTINNDIITAKFNGTMVNQYGYKLSGSSTNDVPTNLVVDANYNQIVIGTTNANTVGNLDMYITKYSSSGTLDWQRTIGTSTRDSLVDVTLVDSDANIIAVGSSASSTNGWIGKFNSSNGNLLAQYTTTNYITYDSITTDSSGNVYIVATQNSTNDGVLILKMTSGFSKTWGQYITYTGYDLAGKGVAVAGNGDVYVTVSRNATNEDFLLKFNSSGTLQWQTGFNYGTNSGFTATTVDPNNNVYIAGTFGSPTTIQLLKFDTSGNLVWNRGLNGYGGTDDVGVTNISYYNNAIIISGYTFQGSTRYGLVLSVPTDGSKVATYPDGYIWGFGPFTKATSTLSTTSSTGPAFTTATLTDSAGTLTNTSYSISVFQTIPF